MNEQERKEWAIRQTVTAQDREYAADIMDDCASKPSHIVSVEEVAQWVRKIRVEGALSAYAADAAEIERISALWVAETRENERLTAALRIIADPNSVRPDVRPGLTITEMQREAQHALTHEQKSGET